MCRRVKWQRLTWKGTQTQIWLSPVLSCLGNSIATLLQPNNNITIMYSNGLQPYWASRKIKNKWKRKKRYVCVFLCICVKERGGDAMLILYSAGLCSHAGHMFSMSLLCKCVCICMYVCIWTSVCFACVWKDGGGPQRKQVVDFLTKTSANNPKVLGAFIVSLVILCFPFMCHTWLP